MTVNKDDISYKDFRNDVLLPNLPWIGRLSESSHWKATSLWVDANGAPNWEYLKSTYGKEEVIVYDCSSGTCKEANLRNVLERWKTRTANTKLYIKDWHLALHCEILHKEAFYTVPTIFADDWMNDFYVATKRKEEDFRFVYAGLAGTFTGIHCDVYGSYSWSHNIVGTKKWYLFPPSVAHFLRRDISSRTSELLSNVHNVDLARFPHFAKAKAEMIVIEQKAGQTIFIPSGYFHQVDNLTDCISINHNWCNAHNIQSMFSNMLAETADVQEALQDVKELVQRRQAVGWQREWHEICQSVLEQNAGWRWLTFMEMIYFHLESLSEKAQSTHRPPQVYLIEQVKSILNEMQTREEVKDIPQLGKTIERCKAELSEMGITNFSDIPNSQTTAWRYWRDATAETGIQAERKLLESGLDFGNFATDPTSIEPKACMLDIKLPNGDIVNGMEVLPPNFERNEDRFTKPAILLLHGFGSGLALWYKNLPSLAEFAPTQRIIAIDWLGMGFSDRRQIPFVGSSRADRAKEVEEFFSQSLEEVRKALGIRTFHIVAHSLGGYFSTLYAMRFPQSVARLTLISGAGFGNMADIVDQVAEPPSTALINRVFPILAKKSSTIKRDENDKGLAYNILHFLWKFDITPLQVCRRLGPVSVLAVATFVHDKFGKCTDPELMHPLFDYCYRLTMMPAGSENCLPSIIQAGGIPHFPLAPKLQRFKGTNPFTVDFICGDRDWIGRPHPTLHVAGKPINLHVIENAGHLSFLENADQFNATLHSILKT